jgi:membrane fusion protein, heavy metal efflux system
MRGETYDIVAIYKDRRITFYVDRLSDNSPVTDAVLDVTATANAVQLTAAAAGIYTMDVGEIAPGGSQELVVSVTGPGGDDLVAGRLDLPGSADHPKAAHGHLYDRLRALISWMPHTGPGGSSQMDFGGGVLAGFLFAALLLRRRSRTAAALGALVLALSGTPSPAGPGGDGHSHGDEAPSRLTSDAPHRLPDGSVFLPKPTQRLLEVRTVKAEDRDVRKTLSFSGRVIADPHRSGVVQSINGGRVLAADGQLPKLGQQVKKGDVLALVEPPVNAADETTIGDKMGEIIQQITLVEVRLQRLAPLAASNAIPRTQVTDLETELQALRKRQANLRAQRRQPEELRAPVDGEVAAVRVVAGQVVAPQDQIFQIVHPQGMWVEAFAFGTLDVASIKGAVAISHHGKTLDLRFQGFGRVLQAHAIQLQFSIENPSATLMVGQPATVLVETNEQVKGIVLPREAVVRAPNGDMLVWQHAASERLVPKPVRAELVNGEHFVVLAGLETGQSVVVKGAELINQVR